jgi:hypothetical protein
MRTRKIAVLALSVALLAGAPVLAQNANSNAAATTTTTAAGAPAVAASTTANRSLYAAPTTGLGAGAGTGRVPEIDPGSAGSALALLAGGLAVLRGRLRRK